MSKLALDYYDRITGAMKAVRDTQVEAVDRAASEIASRLEKGGILYAFGSGHSHMMAEEVYARAGGLIQARALMPHELTVDLDMDKSTLMERTDGLAEIVFATHRIRPLDALLIISNSGRNPVPVQMARIARERGIFTAALTNVTHSKAAASRDKSGKKLYELCDVVLDTRGPLGDALVPAPGRDYAVGPASTILGALILEMLVCAVVETLLDRGIEPALLQSANLDGGDEHNRRAREALRERFPELRDVFSVF
ncbi:MAG: SIS domain-containing protein [Treponema sp.]|nr:SIS domain-containing protein [Treponema sp.]